MPTLPSVVMNWLEDKRKAHQVLDLDGCAGTHKNSGVRPFGTITAWPRGKTRLGRWVLGKFTGRGSFLRMSSACGEFLCVCAGVCLDREVNLKVRFPCHSGRFQEVGNALGLWAAWPEGLSRVETM